MLLKDLIARLDGDEGVAQELIARGDIALMSGVGEMAHAFDETLAEYLMNAVRRFSNLASPDDWLQAMAQVGRVSDPGGTLIVEIAKWALAEDRKAFGGQGADDCRECGGAAHAHG